MSETPDLGRRGFRNWREVLTDLAAIEKASPPLNYATISMYDPSVGGVASTGVLAVQASHRYAVLVVDETEVVRLDQASFRGGWLWLQDNSYYLDLDVGEHHCIQLRGGGD